MARFRLSGRSRGGRGVDAGLVWGRLLRLSLDSDVFPIRWYYSVIPPCGEGADIMARNIVGQFMRSDGIEATVCRGMSVQSRS
jgi:hypothetical protein